VSDRLTVVFFPEGAFGPSARLIVTCHCQGWRLPDRQAQHNARETYHYYSTPGFI